MNSPPNPWAFLGLDRATSSGRDVKRAYARLLKLHRPDQDPEGFQRVSDAYQQALRELASADSEPVAVKQPQTVPPPLSTALPDTAMESPAAAALPDAGGESDPSLLSPSSPDGPVMEETKAAASPEPSPRQLEDFPDLPEKFLTAFENLKQRLQRAAHVPEVPEFNLLRNMVRENPALAAPWAAMLEALFSTERGLRMLPQIHARDVLMLMQHGESSCAARILLSWRDDVSLLSRLTQLANQMLDRKVADQPGMPAAMHFTAKLAAFYLPPVSARLADELYRQTGPGVREQVVREIEIRSAAGKIFSILSHPQRRFWEHQLFESGEGGTNWSSPENAAALKTVLLNCDQNWEGWPIVAQIVPREVLDDSLRRERLAQAETNVRDARHYIRANPGHAFLCWLSRWREWIPSGRWILVVLWLMGHLISSISKTGSGSSSHLPSSSFPGMPASPLYDSKGIPRPANGRNQDMRDALDQSFGSSPGGGDGSKRPAVPASTSTINSPTLDYQPRQSGSFLGGGGYSIGG